MSPLSVPNFSPIRARIRVLWRILRSVRNEEEKNEEKLKRNFVRSYLRNGWSDFLQIWYVNGGSRMGHLGQMPPPSRNCIQDRDTLIEQSITLIKQSQCS